MAQSLGGAHVEIVCVFIDVSVHARMQRLHLYCIRKKMKRGRVTGCTLVKFIRESCRIKYEKMHNLQMYSM